MKLDLKDKQILYELDKNSRQPLSKIAKQVHLSRESILYRIKKYTSEGLIQDYLPVINLAKFGLTIHKICVKLHNITEREEVGLINDLVSRTKIPWVSSCDGKYSLLFAIKSKDLIELNEIIKDIRNKYAKFFLNMEIVPIIRGIHFYRDYLIGKKGTTKRKIVWGGKEEPVKLDQKNIEIINLLCKNGRTSAVEIAKEINISSDAVIQRIKHLENSRVIEHYMIWPDVNKLKGLYYKVLVTLKETKSEEKLYEYCLQNPNIVYIVNCFGPWQFEMDIEVENIEEFRNVMRDFLNSFPEMISDYTPLNIYKEYKFRFFETI
jgi:Lrp/AsnC family transcriptional regulator, leucine-responsive regulatory protein